MQDAKPTDQALNTETGNTTPAPGGNAAPESITLTSEQLRERLERERKRVTKELEAAQAEKERLAALGAEERAKEAEKAAQKAVREAEARILRAERKAELTGKVSNPERVLSLIELDKASDLFDGNAPRIDAILAAYPEYAPAKGGPAPTSPAGGPKRGALTMADLRTMTPDEINARWEEVKQLKG